MAGPDLIDPVNASLLATDMAQTLAEGRKNAEFTSTQSRLLFLAGLEKIGTREAQAMQEVRTSAQAREILQANAAAVQPRQTGT